MISVAVVYESVFGNTRAIAEAVAQGVREANPDTHVEVLGVADATPAKIGAAALLVVGGPTHMRGLSKKSSRRRALHDIEDATTDNGRRREVVEGLGVREWLGALPRSPHGYRAAAFDTRLAAPQAGGAARSVARRLRRHGYQLVAKPEGFVVDGAHGPLRAGELVRAKAWAAALAPEPPGHPEH